ncbi:putative manganese transporter [Halobacterium yunchengense]|uniref:putative manganese transporter n=1 Tax=Halobacterium yunchengense TaxID=3108497 RepID=UPI00300A517F
MLPELADIFLVSVRDAYVQVSAFVAVTVVAFGLLQYYSQGALLARLEANERLQPLVGALLGLTPGCGGAIVVMPLYVRGSVSFGTVVATLAATAGDSAFVILALAPEAAVYAYGLAFVSAVLTGYAIDEFGVGVSRVNRAVARLDPQPDGGTVRADACTVTPGRDHRLLTPLTNALLAAWWVLALAALALGATYLLRGAPEVAFEVGVGFDGLFTVVGVAGTLVSLYLYFVGRRFVPSSPPGRGGTAGSRGAAFRHAAFETSFVTVWVVAGYLVYEYGVVASGVEIQAAAAAAGLLAPVGGAVVGLIPGCGPQIVLATAYSEGAIPFSALAANAVSQDGDALFPLLAVDKTAAVVATIYTTLPALVVGVGLHLAYGPLFGFGVV